ncbi:MAG: transposase [Pseudomonadota bacterium]
MVRLARVVVPGLPHHVTQRGNRRVPIFFAPGDQDIYKRVLAAQLRRRRIEAWAYCLMPNHVHLILTPSDATGMAKALGEAHRRYTTHINERYGWTGLLFQGRFASVVMDEAHLLTAFRYVALNPVRAGLAPRAQDWPWSSVRAHLAGRDDGLVRVEPLLSRFDRFDESLETEPTEPSSWRCGRGKPRDGLLAPRRLWRALRTTWAVGFPRIGRAGNRVRKWRDSLLISRRDRARPLTEMSKLSLHLPGPLLSLRCDWR